MLSLMTSLICWFSCPSRYFFRSWKTTIPPFVRRYLITDWNPINIRAANPIRRPLRPKTMDRGSIMATTVMATEIM